MTSARHRVIAVAGVIAIAGMAYRHVDLLGDSFWYAAVGRAILATRGLPAFDPFSFTASQVPWIVHMPLAQVLFAVVADRLGLFALLAMGGIVFAAALSIVWLGGARTAAGRIVTLPLVLFAVALQADDLCTRGQVFGDLAFALLVVLSLRLHDGKRVSPLLGALLGAAWINLHSSALAAPAVVIVQVIALGSVPRAELATRRALLLFGLALFTGLFVNPYAHRLVFDVASLASSPSTASIDLFRAPDFRSLGLVATVVGVIGTAGAVLRMRDERHAWPEAALLLVWLCATCFARRHIEFLTIAWIAIAGRLADAQLGRHPEAARRLANAGAIVTVSIAIALGVVAVRTRKDPLAHVPVDAAEFVRRERSRENVLNMYHWGGYLDAAWAGHPRVFIDGRNQLFDNGVFRDHDALAAVAPGWRHLLDVYDIHTILWESGSGLDLALGHDTAWREAFRGRLAVVYVRVEKAPER